ncbi:hypothetical protein [Aggregatibacter kilianii]|uniref:hypothetical protein n=1 Tax=Aggregatibacter kilianii TaxID=2025884 RepID=UPI000D6581C8|nr:hypothetical protein [Aggregatibacter kilianii]
MVIKLVPEKVDFLVSTTDLKVIYTESNGVKLYVDVQTYDDFEVNNYRKLEVHFSVVAEVKCTTLNFFENHYNDFQIENFNERVREIDFWKENKYHPDPLFYQVADSGVLNKKGKIFDPNNKLGLKHYLIIGYDSYVEVIASRYQSAFLDN